MNTGTKHLPTGAKWTLSIHIKMPLPFCKDLYPRVGAQRILHQLPAPRYDHVGRGGFPGGFEAGHFEVGS